MEYEVKSKGRQTPGADARSVCRVALTLGSADPFNVRNHTVQTVLPSFVILPSNIPQALSISHGFVVLVLEGREEVRIRAELVP